MCGRFHVSKKKEDIEQRFQVKFDFDLYQPNYNAAPAQLLPVISSEQPELVRQYRWGLIPFWAKDASIGSRMINAKSETLTEKVSFKNLLKSKRCLVVADGFYEWKKLANGKQPYRICLKSEELFAFAGLWDSWKDPTGKHIHSFTIITTEANSLVSDIHDRMPVILPPSNEQLWLKGGVDEKELLLLLSPLDPEQLTAYPVSPAVNSVANNSPGLLLAV